MSSHTHTCYKRSSMWIKTIVVYFFAFRLFRFWIAVFGKQFCWCYYLYKLFLLLFIYSRRGVIRTPANIWDRGFWSNSKQLLAFGVLLQKSPQSWTIAWVLAAPVMYWLLLCCVFYGFLQVHYFLQLHYLKICQYFSLSYCPPSESLYSPVRMRNSS